MKRPLIPPQRLPHNGAEASSVTTIEGDTASENDHNNEGMTDAETDTATPPPTSTAATTTPPATRKPRS